MTRKQLQEANELRSELIAKFPEVEWRVSYNYYTKLVEFTAVNDIGGFAFSMTKTYRGQTYISLNYNDTTRAEDSMTVSHGFGTDLLKEDLPRLNFAKYLAFVRANAYLVNETIAVIAE